MLTPSDVVVLVGPMAVGKSAVGRMLARRTDRVFLDTDRLIVDRYGPIKGIFEQRGEDGFRELEADVVQEAVAGADIVSLGGGAVVHPRTRELLQHASVVFLDTDAATIRPRIRRDTGRPLLAGNPIERWQELYDLRRPLYEQLATVVVDSRGLSVRGTADAVLRALPISFAAGDAPRTTHAAQNHESRTDPHVD